MRGRRWGDEEGRETGEGEIEAGKGQRGRESLRRMSLSLEKDFTYSRLVS